MMRSLIDTENELRRHEQVLMDLYQQVIRGDPVVYFTVPFPGSLILNLAILSRKSLLAMTKELNRTRTNMERRHRVKSMRNTTNI